MTQMVLMPARTIPFHSTQKILGGIKFLFLDPEFSLGYNWGKIFLVESVSQINSIIQL